MGEARERVPIHNLFVKTLVELDKLRRRRVPLDTAMVIIAEMLLHVGEHPDDRKRVRVK